MNYRIKISSNIGKNDLFVKAESEDKAIDMAEQIYFSERFGNDVVWFEIDGIEEF